MGKLNIYDEHSRWLKLRNIDAWQGDKKILSNINLDFYIGQNVAILGPNGSGKTSFLHLINRTLYPKIREGTEIKIFGKSLINIWILRKYIGFHLDEIDKRVDKDGQVRDIILSGYNGLFKAREKTKIGIEQKKRLNKVINQFGLNEIRNISYRNLSEGQKKRVLISRAIVHKPKILILDEPTNKLDLKANWNLLKLINDISTQDMTLILVTHNVDTIIKSINRIIFMKSGRIIDDGPPDEMMTSSKLSDLYEVKLDVINSNDSWRLIPKK